MQLNAQSLSALPREVRRPATRPYGIGIVHLGLGAFHRAHQVEYTEDASSSMTSSQWGICGVSLKRPRARDQVAPQDTLYTLVKKSPSGIERRVLGNLCEALFLGDERARVVERLAAVDTAIVTLTITEKGYGYDAASGRLERSHPDIAADLADASAPRSAVGLIVEALDARRRSHGKPFTVLSCDNLPRNGAVLRTLALEFASTRDAGLARWIDEQARFPSTMVDRIVPATTADDVAENDAALGLHDAAPVVCEPFAQWVIEDAFVAGRPAWERAGAQLVDDVAPFEAMKLKLLNGSHSALAYLGFLAGHEFIYQVAAVPAFEHYMRALMSEATPTLRVPARVDLTAYCNALVERFKNPALPHRTRQVAMDGSQKLPQRLLASVRGNLAAYRPIERLTLAIAAWMRYVHGRDERGAPIDVSDPLARRLGQIAAANRDDPTALAHALLAIESIFGTDLRGNQRFTEPLIRWLRALFAQGAARTVQRSNDA
ncbi:MAG TPA: mannitol dehydrogenase family protein [Casimicrobiaceae bacterium]|nr:mannitol dehydrogenase family protein [Casimicrobiaceae bacterium]